MKAWRYGLVVVALLGLFVWFAHPAVAEEIGCENGGCEGDYSGVGCDNTCPPGNPGGGGEEKKYPEEPPYVGGNSTCSLISSVPAVEPAF